MNARLPKISQVVASKIFLPSGSRSSQSSCLELPPSDSVATLNLQNEWSVGAEDHANRGRVSKKESAGIISEGQGVDTKSLEAFNKVIDEYQHRVLGFVKRMVPTNEDAQDITQEVFIRAFQNFDRFDARASIRTWLFRIAYNLCVDRTRKVNRGLKEMSLYISNEIDEEFEVPDERWQPDILLEDEQLKQIVENAIAGMSEKLRSVLLLHDKEDLSYEEIAETLKIPIGTVKSRLFLARNQLQSAVREFLGEQQ